MVQTKEITSKVNQNNAKTALTFAETIINYYHFFLFHCLFLSGQFNGYIINFWSFDKYNKTFNNTIYYLLWLTLNLSFSLFLLKLFLKIDFLTVKNPWCVIVTFTFFEKKPKQVDQSVFIFFPFETNFLSLQIYLPVSLVRYRVNVPLSNHLSSIYSFQLLLKIFCYHVKAVRQVENNSSEILIHYKTTEETLNH